MVVNGAARFVGLPNWARARRRDARPLQNGLFWQSRERRCLKRDVFGSPKNIGDSKRSRLDLPFWFWFPSSSLGTGLLEAPASRSVRFTGSWSLQNGRSQAGAWERGSRLLPKPKLRPKQFGDTRRDDLGSDRRAFAEDGPVAEDLTDLDSMLAEGLRRGDFLDPAAPWHNPKL